MSGLGLYVLDEHGDPREAPDVLAWGRWFETANRSVGLEHPIPGVRVSTVFLGLDHAFPRGGAPLLWETMIFGGAHDEACWRYSSRAAAEAGHRRAVELVLEGVFDE